MNDSIICMTVWQCSVVSFILMSTNFHGFHGLQSNDQQRVENITTIGIDKRFSTKYDYCIQGSINPRSPSSAGKFKS